MSATTSSTPSDVSDNTPKKRVRKPASRTKAGKKPPTGVTGTETLNTGEVAKAQKSAIRKTSTRRRKNTISSSDAVADADIVTQPAQPATSVPDEVPVTPRRRTTRSVTAKKPSPDKGKESVPKKRLRSKKLQTTPEEMPSEAPSAETGQEEALLPSFDTLGLSEPVLRAIADMGYTQPTPIQAGTIPDILLGRDVLGVAQTGTGKTASFTLPLLEKLSKSRARARMPRSLILEPTRELALQVAENFEQYGKYLRLNHALLIGGGSMNEQRDLLNRGVDVLIATPGRLLDLFDRGGLLLTQTDLLVIDEADRMLDMGFIPDIERIVSLLPTRRQTLFFSATMAPEIRRLADAFLNNPKEIAVARQSSVASTISERVFTVKQAVKQQALRTLLKTENVQNAIIFCNRKRDVDSLQAYLSRHRFSVGHLHGDLNQSVRFETLERFRAGDLKILVCSDVAARGIDIDGLSHVFNYDLPFNAEDYVHRIGRTGRAGNEGYAFSLVTPEDLPLLDAVEKLTGTTIEHGTIETLESPVRKEDRADSSPPFPESSRPHHGKISSKQRARAIAPQSPEDGNPPPLDKKGFLPAISEKEGLQLGFGDLVPAFMKVSFPPQPRSFPVA